MYSSKEIRQELHRDIKSANKMTMSHPIAHGQSKVRMPKGMTGDNRSPSFDCRRVTDGDESQNIRQVFHF